MTLSHLIHHHTPALLSISIALVGAVLWGMFPEMPHTVGGF